MSQERLPLAVPAHCLMRPYPASQKGGTLIIEEVTDRAMHELRLSSPDGYRPSRCARCGHDVLHLHDYPERKLFAEPLDAERPAAVVRIVRHECAACWAIWRILPTFLARRLWRSWAVVEAVTVGAPPPATQPEVSPRTQRRWRARLASSAVQLVQVLATSAQTVLEAIASTVGLAGARQDLVAAYATATDSPRGHKLANLAALIHRLVPGVRLM